ncbi:MAG: RIP metalloprotease RseP [Pseudomonadota bacterium]
MIETLYTIGIFIVVLSIVVFVHEFGHYIVGRWCGIHADTFSVGMGPALFGWTDRRGTRWQIAAVPLGGYVKFLGDSNAASAAGPNGLSNVASDDVERTLLGASLWKRALTVAAGPLANFLLSIIIFAGLLYVTGIARDELKIGEFHKDPIELQSGDRIVGYNGQPVERYSDIFEYSAETPEGGDVTYTVERDDRVIDAVGPYPYPALIGYVQPLSSAADAGLEAKDEIIRFNGEDVASFETLRDRILARGAIDSEIVVLRDGGERTFSITPQIVDTQAADGGFEERVMIGVGAQPIYDLAVERPTVGEALNLGVIRTYGVITTSLDGLYHMIIGDIGADNLQGPVGIARASADTASSGVVNLIAWIALISTAIGLMNLFPIPVLDGGHLVLYAYEAIRGRPPREKVAAALTAGGLSLLLCLMVFATYNDVLRLLNA